MNAQQLQQEISDYCRLDRSRRIPFGRRAVNDGKLASRLRNGGASPPTRSTASAPS
jgi:hypothetical protein